jgi:tRNA A-37 threonylcarbamoyl transferase component Bud32
VRRLEGTPPDVASILAAWLDAGPGAGVPGSPRPLKSDGSVVAARFPGAADEVAVKLFRPRVRDRFRTPRAVRAFRRAYALRVRGVSCPAPLAAASRPDGAGILVSELLGDGEGDASDLDRAARGRDGAPAEFPRLARATRTSALFELGRFLRRMHDAEVSHRDLKAPNLVARRAGGRVTFALVDLEGTRIRRGPVSWRRRARDLARLDASVGPAVSRADRRRVLAGYFASFRRARVPLGAFARRVAAASARKRGPSGAPR